MILLKRCSRPLPILSLSRKLRKHANQGSVDASFVDGAVLFRRHHSCYVFAQLPYPCAAPAAVNDGSHRNWLHGIQDPKLFVGLLSVGLVPLKECGRPLSTLFNGSEFFCNGIESCGWGAHEFASLPAIAASCFMLLLLNSFFVSMWPVSCGNSGSLCWGQGALLAGSSRDGC